MLRCLGMAVTAAFEWSGARDEFYGACEKAGTTAYECWQV